MGQRVVGIGVTGRMPQADPSAVRRMRITTTNTSPLRASADVLVVTVAKPPVLAGAAAELDSALGGTLTGLIDAGEIRGARGQVTVVHAPARRARPPRRRGRPGCVTRTRRRPPGGRRERAGGDGAPGPARLAFVVDSVPLDRELASRCLVEGAMLGEYRFDRYRSEPAADRPSRLDTVTLIGGDRRQAQRATVVATAANRARDLQNTPSNHLGPQQLGRARPRDRERARDA